MKLAVLALVWASLAAGGVSAEELKVAFESTKVLDAIVVTIQVNGRPAALIFDTGSNMTILSPELAKESGSKVGISFPETGATRDAWWGEVKMEISGHVWKKRKVVVQDQQMLCRIFERQIDGILGKDVMNEFHSVTVDLKARCIIFRR